MKVWACAFVLLMVSGSMGQAQAADAPDQAADDAKVFGRPVSIALAAGYKLVSFQTQPNRLVLHLRAGTVDEIDIVDLNDGHIVAVIHGEESRQ